MRSSTNPTPVRRSSLGIPGGEQRPVPVRPSLEERLAAAMPLDERQRRLVALLLAGHTDASAAGRLGVSPRTVTNILRSLMDRLGVDNRFQLGVALGSRMRVPDRPNHPPRPVPSAGEPMPGFGVPMPSARREASA
ncbi:helix-turn-helix transcriptional regulator [Streptomyces sp. NPDC101225]|uniref:helix-turn-helix domain-containing protein n=1 Tax=Streptomyces sp. NPDC101225 TaxID=3366135 RepID=UPI00382217FF